MKKTELSMIRKCYRPSDKIIPAEREPNLSEFLRPVFFSVYSNDSCRRREAAENEDEARMSKRPALLCRGAGRSQTATAKPPAETAITRLFLSSE